MRATVQAHQAQHCATISPQYELDQYLAAPLEDVEDVVAWWGVRILILYYFDV